MTRSLKTILLCTLIFAGTAMRAEKGMWIPALLKAVEGDMQAMGLHLSADDIYSINHGSLKDAIVHFGGGCTAEMVSKEGLLLTNHHCGYSQIASHSSVENDYLTDGYWAMSRSDELANEGLTATFIDRIEEVTARLEGLEGEARSEMESLIVSEVTDGTDLEGEIVAFDFGNSYFLITTLTYLDVRLVGAPPSSVGKFGGDTDNWIWPRHTGDFSVFRVYADADNRPSEYTETNVPYRPAHHLPVNIGGIEAGDFTMVFGFPGHTDQYLTSDAVEHVIEELNPMRIEMREAGLAVINSARASSAELRIAYASKQSSVANAWKKWIGQSIGLIELDALGQKRALESAYARHAHEGGSREYAAAIPAIQAANGHYFPYLEARALFIELAYYGPDILNFALAFSPLVYNYEALEASGDLAGVMDDLIDKVEEQRHAVNPSVDAALMAALLPPYLKHIEPRFIPMELADASDNAQDFTDRLYAKSIFDDYDDLVKALAKPSRKAFSKWKKDPALRLIEAIRNTYFTQIAPEYGALQEEIRGHSAVYVRALREMFPDQTFSPDANSTLRLTYGKVEGSAPHDGERYEPFTTARGILQKYKPGDPEFDLPEDLVALLRDEQWGDYANADGDLPVCFTGSNHTTGGNSGSPTIDGDGNLVGINFDRSWESTMSDIWFDSSRCRNIMVDIRYVLWVIDVYAGAGHLVKEMDLVR